MKLIIEISDVEYHALAMLHHKPEQYLLDLVSSIARGTIYQRIGVAPDKLASDSQVEEFMGLPTFDAQQSALAGTVFDEQSRVKQELAVTQTKVAP